MGVLKYLEIISLYVMYAHVCKYICICNIKPSETLLVSVIVFLFLFGL